MGKGLRFHTCEINTNQVFIKTGSPGTGKTSIHEKTAGSAAAERMRWNRPFFFISVLSLPKIMILGIVMYID